MVPVPEEDDGRIQIAISAGSIALSVAGLGTSNLAVEAMDVTISITEVIMRLNEELDDDCPESGVNVMRFADDDLFAVGSENTGTPFTGEARYMVHLESEAAIDQWRINAYYEARPADPTPTRQHVRAFSVGGFSLSSCQ